MEYGIMRSFASTADRDAFYQTPLYRERLTRIEPMVEGEATYRQLEGLEAWFRSPHAPMPPRWKMALLTWIAVWPVHARSSDSDASARSKFCAGSHGRTHCCRDRRDPGSRCLCWSKSRTVGCTETARGTAANEQRIMKTREPLVGKIERLVHRDGRISWDYTTKMPFLDTAGSSSESAESIKTSQR
jgi:hypothetical protein